MFDITTGKAMYAQDIHVPGMKFAVIERPPVVLGKAVSFDEAAAMKVPGVVKVVMIHPTPMPAKFAPLGGVARDRGQHLGGDEGAQGAERHLG